MVVEPPYVDPSYLRLGVACEIRDTVRLGVSNGRKVVMNEQADQDRMC
jgi:hypothetical protein